MKKFLFAALAIVLMSGCATVYEPFETREMAPDPVPAVRQFISLRQIQQGMTSAEVKAVLGSQVVVGYEMPDVKETRYKPLVKENPCRVEEYVKGAKHYFIEYYLTGINQSDGVVTDDELTPLIFEKDKLIGWGWDFWKSIK